MKCTGYVFLGLLLIAAPVGAADHPDRLKTEVQKLSYAFGLDLGAYFKSLEQDFDLSLIQSGINDAYTGRKALMTHEEARAALQQFATRQQEGHLARVAEMATANKEAAKKFLAENKRKKGVRTTASGLQYKVLKKGKGIKPGSADTVRVHYKGTLLDGTEFDSSYKRNEPAEFQVNQVIAGWGEALQLMNVGSTYELYLPPELAYDDQGAPPVIEPGSMLIFEVELLDVVGKDQKAEKAEKAAK